MAGLLPGGQAAVEHPHIRVAGIDQQPPQAAGGHTAAAVIDHDGAVIAHTQTSSGALEMVRAGQWVPTFAPGGVGQLGFEINLEDVHGQTEGKIYCIIGAAYVYSSCGGLDVDTNMNLLTTEGTPIENVYVVGNDSLGVLNESNKAYVTYGGAAQGWALTSGRLAGANAAAKYAG